MARSGRKRSRDVPPRAGTGVASAPLRGPSKGGRGAGPDALRLEGLRGRTKEAPPGPLVIAALAVPLSPKTWIGQFSRLHPEVRVEVLNLMPVSDGFTVSDVWFSSGGPGTPAEEIGSMTGVDRAEFLIEMGIGGLYRVTYATPRLLDRFRTLGIPAQFPWVVRAGEIHWEVVARDAELRRMVAYLREFDPAAVVSVRRRSAPRSDLADLTTLQRQLLATALSAGYFAVPRAITLTQLARQIGRSKSALSESLATIERKVLEASVRPPSRWT